MYGLDKMTPRSYCFISLVRSTADVVVIRKCHYLEINTEGFGLPRWHIGKESACQCGRCGFDLWVGKIPWRRKWQSTPVFLPGEFHGQRSLAGYSPWGHTESDMT